MMLPILEAGEGEFDLKIKDNLSSIVFDWTSGNHCGSGEKCDNKV